MEMHSKGIYNKVQTTGYTEEQDFVIKYLKEWEIKPRLTLTRMMGR